MGTGRILEVGDVAGARGLAYCHPAITDETPVPIGKGWGEEVRTAGVGVETSLKMAEFDSHAREFQEPADLNYITLVRHSGGNRVWRDKEPNPAEAGAIGMYPFEASRYRVEGRVRVMHAYVPFTLVRMVGESLFDRELVREQLWISMGAREERLSRTMSAMHAALASIEPTNLILDSWALMLSEILVSRFSSHAERNVRASYGKLPAHRLAYVIDFIEANIAEDLSLAAMANVASMSVYHFARRFRDTIGMSPHAYVTMRRLRKAQELLKVGRLPLIYVAAACGFCSQAHFTTVFGRAVGAAPGEYRRSLMS